MNREYSHKIIKKLLEWGVAEFYVCAGARNITLVETVLNIQSSKKKIVFNHFEERSAAFYALGRIKSLKKPVAVITTSGTAVGELLPAVMEAYYSGLPLVLITADRPRAYRGTGAPQTAEQKNIFGTYVSECFDLENDVTFDISHIPHNKPLHINVCFDVPLQSGSIQPLAMPQSRDLPVSSRGLSVSSRGLSVSSRGLTTGTIKSQFFDQIEKFEIFLANAINAIVIVSQIPACSKLSVIQFLKKLNYPIYFESTSNLSNSKELSHLRIYCADKIWNNSKKANYTIDSVIKIGGTPTHRFWRDLDETQKHIKVFSIHHLPFSGMPNAEHITINLGQFFNLSIKLKLKKIENSHVQLFLSNDRESLKKLYKLFELYPRSEQSFFYCLSNIINKNSHVYLGNSMPIRYWDLIATAQKFVIEASRGLNGIDGQISTFLGFSHESSDNWGIFGDLTTLYDLAGPWMLRHRSHLNVNIVIINNAGGKIFSRVLQGKNSEFCQNSHQLQFIHFAKMWNLNYRKITSFKQLKNLNSSGQNMIEIVPRSEQTTFFANDWDLC